MSILQDEKHMAKVASLQLTAAQGKSQDFRKATFLQMSLAQPQEFFHLIAYLELKLIYWYSFCWSQSDTSMHYSAEVILNLLTEETYPRTKFNDQVQNHHSSVLNPFS